MNILATKTKENKSQAAANRFSERRRSSVSAFVDNRPEAIAQRKMQEMINNSLRAKKTAQLQASIKSNLNPQPILKNKTGLPGKLKAGIENLSG